MDIRTNIHLMSKPGNLKAIADVNLGEEFAVKGLRIIEGEKGLFVAMPSRSIGDNKYEDIFFPITAESREKLHSTILEEYDKKLTQQEEQKNEKGQKGSKKGQTNDKQSGDKSQKEDDAPEQTDAELSQEGEEQIEEGPAMSM